MNSPSIPISVQPGTRTRRRWLRKKPGRTLRHVMFWMVIILIGHVLLLELMLTLSSRARDPGFTDHFDDPTLPGWEHNPAASVDEGVLRMEPGAVAFTSYQWGNVSITVRARRWGNGSLTVSYRSGDRGGYDVHFGDLSVSLTRSTDGTTVELASVPVSVPAGVWVTIHVTAMGNIHAVSLEGETLFECHDPNPFRSSMIGLLNNGPGGATGEFDDLKVIGDSSPEVMVELPPGTPNP